MRKYSLMLLAVLLVFALALGAVACGSSSSSSKNPQELLTASVTAGKAATSQSGNYEIDLTLKMDATATTDAMTQMLSGQPIKVTGTFADQQNPVQADLSLAVNLLGTSINAGVRAIDTNAWLNVLGQWYEIPADQLQQAGGTSNADVVKTIQDAMDEQGIDFNNWIKDLKTAGDETVADTKVTHLTGTLDVQKMVTDLVALMQDPKVAALVATAGSEASSQAGTSVTVPDATAIAQLQTTVQQMIKTATVDLWVAKSDSSMRKIALNTEVVIPAEMASSGVSGATVVFYVNLDAPGTVVAVKAPEGAKPFADLQTDLQSNPLLSGLGSLLGGSGSSLGGVLGGGETTTTAQ
jgi:hypothetical protein